MGNLPRGASLDETFTASGDLSSYQYRFVKQTADNTVAICGAGERILGILQNAPESGQAAVVRTGGMSLLYANAGTAISVTNHMKSAALGVGIKGEADLDEVGATAREAKASGLGTILVKLLDAVSISEEPADETIIVVSTAGDDATGSGSFANPLASLTAALALASDTRKTIYMLAGEYEEAAKVDWPDVNGVGVFSLGGDVLISEAAGGSAVIDIKPAFTTATFEATLGVGIKHTAQIGLDIDNAGMGTRKLNVYLVKGFFTEQVSTGHSVNVTKGVSGQAVRIYGDGVETEGLFNWVTSTADDRLRLKNSDLAGGLTTAGAIASEVTLVNTIVLTGALTIGSATQVLAYVGCVYRSDAGVYTELANTYSS